MKTTTKTIKTLDYPDLIPSIPVGLGTYFLHYYNEILGHAGSDEIKAGHSCPKLEAFPAGVLF